MCQHTPNCWAILTTVLICFTETDGHQEPTAGSVQGEAVRTLGSIVEQYHLQGGNTSTVTHSKCLQKLITSLKWTHVIFLYDNDLVLWAMMDTVQPHNAYSSVSLKKLPPVIDESLQEYFILLHQDKYPDLNFLVLATYQRAMSLLRLVDSVDEISGRRTDFRHQSYWVIALDTPYEPSVSMLSELKHMENVVMVSSNNAPLSGSQIFTLRSVPGGRMFGQLQRNNKGLTREEVFPNLKHGLNNRTLVVSIIQSSGFAMKSKLTGRWEGLFIDVLDEIASTLNFSYVSVEPPDNRYGILINGSWDGAVGQLQRREIDIAVAKLTINEDREEVMDFLLPPADTVVEDFVYRQSDDDSSWLLYIQPTDSVALLLLLAIFVLVSLVLSALTHWDKIVKHRKKPPGLKFDLDVLVENTFYTFAILLLRGQSHSSSPYTWTLRILMVSWGVFSLILATTYSAKLVSLLAVSREKLPFRNLQDLVQQDSYKWGIQGGDITQHIFTHAKYGELKDVWDGIQRFRESDPDVVSPNKSVHIVRMLKEKYAFLSVRASMQKVLSQDCKVRFMGEAVIWHQRSFGVPTHYPLKKYLETVLSQMRDSGLFDVWQEKWMSPSRSQCQTVTGPRVIVLYDIQAAFYILVVGGVLASVVIFVEVLRTIYRASKRQEVL